MMKDRDWSESVGSWEDHAYISTSWIRRSFVEEAGLKNHILAPDKERSDTVQRYNGPLLLRATGMVLVSVLRAASNRPFSQQLYVADTEACPDIVAGKYFQSAWHRSEAQSPICSCNRLTIILRQTRYKWFVRHRGGKEDATSHLIREQDRFRSPARTTKRHRPRSVHWCKGIFVENGTHR